MIIDSITHVAHNKDGSRSIFEINQYPQNRLRCGKFAHVKPVETSAWDHPFEPESYMEIVFSYPACDRFFIAEYFEDRQEPGPYQLTNIIPKEVVSPSYDAIIKKNKP